MTVVNVKSKVLEVAQYFLARNFYQFELVNLLTDTVVVSITTNEMRFHCFAPDI